MIGIRLRMLAGRLCNVLGLPGIVAPCDYQAQVTNASIRVRIGDLFTVISVNGLDVYFHRLTGEIDGIGFSPASDCTLGATPELVHSDASPVDLPPEAHVRTSQDVHA